MTMAKPGKRSRHSSGARVCLYAAVALSHAVAVAGLHQTSSGLHAPVLRVSGGGGEALPMRKIKMGDVNVFSAMSFSHINPLIRAGYERPLEEEELPQLPDQDSARHHGNILEAAWKAAEEASAALERSKAEARGEASGEEGAALLGSAGKKNGGSLALLTACWNVYGRAFMWGGSWKVPHDILTFAAPTLVRLVYRYVDPKEEAELPSWGRGLGLVAAFFFVQYLSSITLHQYFDKVFAVSLQIRAGLVASIYRKALRLSHASRQQKSLGELVNLMSVDVQRLTDLIPYLHNLAWSSPFQIFFAMFLLYRLVGSASLVGLAVMIAVMPVNASILLHLRKLQEGNMLNKDQRVRQVSEMLNSIKVIKMFAWERPLAKRIFDIRETEVDRLKQYGYVSALQSIFWNSAPVTVSIATFGAYTAMGNTLSMKVVLPALAIINIMSFPLFVFPLLISAVISGRVALNRLNDFMSLPELDTSHITPLPPGSPLGVAIEGASLGWNSSMPILNDVNIAFPKGTLTAVVGPVGCGKSTLLAALLGDARTLSGAIRAPTTVGYVPQQAWIQNANVRDNILFGAVFDQAKYDKVVDACALRADLDRLPAGDQTEIGERGVNLSGGQKQRISLARAVYQNEETILLDDVMSALDSHVGHHVMDECLLGLLAGKTRVLVTHKLDVLPAVDRVVVIKEGRIHAQGTLDELQAQGIDLTSIESDDSEANTPNLSSETSDVPTPTLETLTPLQKEEVEEEVKKGDAPMEAKRTASPKAKTPSRGVSPKKAEPGVKAVEEEAVKEGGAPVRSKSSYKLVQTEARSQGAVGAETYMFYFRELRFPLLAAIGIVGILSQAARNGNDWWLTRWASSPDAHKVKWYLGVYAASNVGASLLFLLRDIFCMLTQIAAASSLHTRMLSAVMKAPLSFFDATPAGRILNRFSNDQESLDQTLPRTLNQLYACILRVGGTVAMISTVSPGFLLVAVPLAYLYWYAQQFYSRTSRELKRIESTTKSPLYSHFGESIAGSSCIRAAGAEDRFCQDNCDRVDRVNRLFGLMNTCNRWLAIRLELCGNGIVSGAALTGVVSRRLGLLSPERAALVGLTLTLALAVTNSLGWMVRMSTEAEAQMNAVERVAEYSSLQTEEAWLAAGAVAATGMAALDMSETGAAAVAGCEGEGVEKPRWPCVGEIELDGYSMRYREDLDNVLKDISVKIPAGTKVGVVGRTGAGKSSLLMALYRMGIVAGGAIRIDGKDISSVSLDELRSGLAIVPQEPMLFSGSILYNLDPFNDYSQDAVWEALRAVSLQAYVLNLGEGLQSAVGEGGSNLSVGQRQLLCMARALLKGAKLLVLDEATAAVDEETDVMIQAAVRKACAGVTVVTIAHRLNTVMDYDKVMVLDAGQLVEYDSPQKLLQDPLSHFSQMVQRSRIRRNLSRGSSLGSSEMLSSLTTDQGNSV